ncbi:MAG: phospholipase D-like domain-containing protein [Planctomycetota bacterium]
MKHAWSLLACCLAAASAWGQDAPPPIRDVLAGEPATVVFSPQGGYAPQNYLKRFTTQDGETVWATQNGLLAELIRRAEPGSKIRIGSFKLSEPNVIDALFEAARERGCEVKLWLKGPPGLTYMVDGHEAIADRANRYLRERHAQGKDAEWGDVQVQIGTAAHMSAFGKWNDMHQKFGIVSASNAHGPNLNHAFLGTSNIGASSDEFHNEHRVFLFNHAVATHRLWSEFKRLWDNLGECRTFVHGDSSQGPNQTPEDATITLPDGSTAQERDTDALTFRFTYEREPSGQFHAISDDFAQAISEAKLLPAGAVVWVAQFGFGIPRLSRALLQAAEEAPQVEFRVMVHMAEGNSWATRQLATSNLPNVHVRVKWDSNKLKLNPGSTPGLPGPTDPGPALLHHKTLVVGERALITGSYNFFGDADDQGENVVIVRPERDPRFAGLVRDTHAEFQTLWFSGVLFDAAELFGPDGLYEQIAAKSAQDGFLDVLRAVSSFPQSAEQIRDRVGSLDLPKVEEHLATLTRFRFVEELPAGFRLAPDPDQRAHAAKPDVRREALEHQPTAEVVRGTVSTTERALLVGGERISLEESALDATLELLQGREVAIHGKLAGKVLTPERLVEPTLAQLEGTVAQPPDGPRFGPDALRPAGLAGEVLAHAGPDPVALRGYAYPGELVVTEVEARITAATTLSYSWVPVGKVKPGERVTAVKLSRTGEHVLVETAAGIRGYAPLDAVAIGREPHTAGVTGALGGQ